MKSYGPGGRFDADFETNEILSGMNADLRNPVGTHALWYIYDKNDTVVDPIYDVAFAPSRHAGGREWSGPYTIQVVRAVIKQGDSGISQAGFYNSDTLHLTLNSDDIEAISPGTMANPDFQDRSRIIWKGEVWRPYNAQQLGIIGERYTLLSVDCKQVMPDEMVNDPQFEQYAN
jgi:hypothetical protein